MSLYVSAYFHEKVNKRQRLIAARCMHVLDLCKNDFLLWHIIIMCVLSKKSWEFITISNKTPEFYFLEYVLVNVGKRVAVFRE